jgi:DNA polymerase-1
VLAVQYGQGARSLAVRISRPGTNMAADIVARDLLAAHRRTFRVFWEWNDSYIDTATLRSGARTVFGWPARVYENSNARAMGNFPMQANGAEMLRIASILMIEHGVELCAPVHDAVMIVAPIDRIEAAVTKAKAAMARASREVLVGFELGVDAKIVRYPDRYMDDRAGSSEMWDRIMAYITDVERRAA